MSSLPPYISPEEILVRLHRIFPVGVPNRTFYKSKLSARVVFSMLYIGAVEKKNIYASPSHIYKMTDKQALLSDPESRYLYSAGKAKSEGIYRQWYVPSAGELIRNNVFKKGFIPLGAVHILPRLPANSKKPKYFLNSVFADLFDPSINGRALAAAIEKWQTNRLSDRTSKRAGNIHKALDHLPPRQREVYQMSRMEGYSYKQIAGKLELSLSTVRNLLWQARRHIELEILKNKAIR